MLQHLECGQGVTIHFYEELYDREAHMSKFQVLWTILYTPWKTGSRFNGIRSWSYACQFTNSDYSEEYQKTSSVRNRREDSVISKVNILNSNIIKEEFCWSSYHLFLQEGYPNRTHWFKIIPRHTLEQSILEITDNRLMHLSSQTHDAR